LTRIVTQTLAQNLSWQAALTRVTQARALSAQALATQSPQIDLGAGITRQRRSLETFNSPDTPNQPNTFAAPRISNTWTTDAQLNWQWDVFGEQKLALTAADERVRSSQASAAATRLLVASQAASLVVQARTLHQRIALQRDVLAVDIQLMEIATAKRRAGAIAQALVLQAKSTLQNSKGDLAQLQEQLGDVQSALAVLAAITPAQAAQWLGDSTQIPVTPPSVNVGIPSQLLLRRPDLLEAQSQLRATSADLAASLAQRYPRFTLSAQLGWAAASAAALGSSRALLAALSPDVTWPLLDGGTTKARNDQRQAQREEAVLLYQQAVIRAFAQTQTALQTLELRRTERATAIASQDALIETAQIAKIQADRGHIELSAALQAQRVGYSAKALQASAQQQTLDAVISLYQAVGGGWDAEGFAVFEQQ
jgi:outer membrane protein, multidrug efflux system